MNVREAESADRPAIRDVARRSLQASYTLGPQAITSAIEEWYDEKRLRETLDDPDHRLLVVDRDGQVVAFSETVRSGNAEEATLLWLHVDPAYRGEGIASALLNATMDDLETAGVEHIYGRVLEDNAEGNAFYEDHGFEHVGGEEVEIAGRTYVENLWAETDESGLEPVTDASGRRAYVNRSESETGSVSHFYVVYADQNATRKYGYYCENCDSLANAMDSMGRIECDNCGNVRKPRRWDAAYL
jgi:ribosomal protein S18 acetylase RimI-like enzyme